jgi:hypothetical protein
LQGRYGWPFLNGELLPGLLKHGRFLGIFKKDKQGENA